MNPKIEEKILHVKELCKVHSVLGLYLFGSQLDESYGDDSDVDLLVEFSEDINLMDYSDNFFELHHGLESLFGKKVDLVSQKSLKNPILIQEIEKSKMALL